MKRTWQGWAVLLGAVLGVAAIATAGPPAASLADERIARLIDQLDDDAFPARRQAEAELLRLGKSAWQSLLKQANHESPEVRQRVRRLLRTIEHDSLREAFAKLALEPDERLNVEQGLYLVARIGNPLVRGEELSRQLDELAADVRGNLAASPSPRDPRTVVEAIRQVMYIERGYRGVDDDYDNPANSSLEQVLARRRGLPILLSQVMIAVARRVDLKLEGVSLPRRYMAMFVPPPGKANQEMIIDAYNGGKLTSRDELEDLIAGLGAGFDPASDLTPATPRETLQRVLRNLASDFGHVGDEIHQRDCLEFLELLESGASTAGKNR